MAYLINRNPPARLICLHSICKLIYSKIGFNIFRMNDIKFDPQTENIFSFCPILIEDYDLGLKYCPYKDNPLSQSGCSLTNGITEDTTKSKEVSNTVNALEGLRFIKRVGNELQLSQTGKTFAQNEFNSIENRKIMLNAVLNYGVFAGFFTEILLLGKNRFRTTDIYVGYPNTEEVVNVDGMTIYLSAGSQKDTNTRTKSCMLAWATTLGLIVPSKFKNSHNEAEQYVLSIKRSLREYNLLKNFSVFSHNFIVDNPLNYSNLTKNTKALRENNQAAIRKITMGIEHIINNRRYAIITALNTAYTKGKNLDLDDLTEYLSKRSKFFMVNNNDFKSVIYNESKIGFMAGIPFQIEDDNKLKPLNGINQSILDIGCPNPVIEYMRNFSVK